MNRDSKESDTQKVFPQQRAITLASLQQFNASQAVPSDPHSLASAYFANRCRTPNLEYSVNYWRGELWRWDGRRYSKLTKSEIRAEAAAEARNPPRCGGSRASAAGEITTDTDNQARVQMARFARGNRNTTSDVGEHVVRFTQNNSSFWELLARRR